ncbi:MAG: hypothetical protein ACI9I0_001092 [Rhodoferax sp.]|jgi:hypothetical protein
MGWMLRDRERFVYALKKETIFHELSTCLSSHSLGLALEHLELFHF